MHSEGGVMGWKHDMKDFECRGLSLIESARLRFAPTNHPLPSQVSCAQVTGPLLPASGSFYAAWQDGHDVLQGPEVSRHPGRVQSRPLS